MTEGSEDEKLPVDYGATTHIVNNDKLFTKTDCSVKPEKHFIELRREGESRVKN